jgi:putative sterol carrier protein
MNRQEEYKKTVGRWEEKAQKALVGKTIKKVRYLTAEEVESLGWSASAVVLELSDGTMLFPSRDDEGNDGGAMFGQGGDGEELTFPVIRSYR